MPYNRFTYDELTAQLNVLSHMANSLYAIIDPNREKQKAIQLFSGRLRTEIDRIARNRRKMTRHQPDQYDQAADSVETPNLTLG